MTLAAVFPTDISEGATGGDTWLTDVTPRTSGKEKRTARHSKPLGRWTVGHRTKTKTEWQALRNFFNAVGGRAESWLFKDWLDYESDGQQSCSPATGTGALTAFQLVKEYSVSSPLTDYVRTITRPKSGTLLVYVNNVLKTETTDYTVDYTTGVITFLVAPTNGHTVKATYEFYKVARFDTDEIEASMENGITSAGEGLFSWESIPIVEVDE